MSGLGENIGQFITGSFTKLFLRQKSGEIFEIGQLFVSGEDLNDYSIFQVNELFYGSQIPDNALELMAGYQLERDKAGLAIYEPELRNYVMAQARPLIRVKLDKKTGKLDPYLPKTLPKFFGSVVKINDEHLKFMEETELDNPITIGHVRSGSQVLDTTVSLEAIDVLTHHILIPATTGRGKSNLVKVILFNLIENTNCGKLVFDPHNEYHESLREHPESNDYLRYYTPREHVAKIDLQFNLNLITPGHVMGAIEVSQPQREALILYHRQYQDQWIDNLFRGDVPEGVDQRTINALRRKVGVLLNLEIIQNNGEVQVNDRGIYKLDGYETTVNDILKFLEDGKTVVIDTSLFTGSEEIFIATIIVERLFYTYKRYKFNNQLQDFPVISIVLEEAPRVIGKSALNVSQNVFETIAREGRKFNIGLIAITQLPSIIDREILANMNTKIILGNEMGPERKAIIESAAQDLSDDYQNIGSLDKGEAIITSNFTKFAVPIKIPLISEVIGDYKNKNKDKNKNFQRKSPF